MEVYSNVNIDPLGPFPALAAILLALGLSYFFINKVGIPGTVGRFVTIDGLRGYLALFVFLHHSSIWYYVLRTNRWEVPPSKLYTHFGESSVLFFFMISGFLFWAKLLDARNKHISWVRLYVSRIMRLIPLYYFFLLLVICITAVLSNFALKEPPAVLLNNIFEWSTLRIFGTGDINGVQNLWVVIAGATWTLPYEWLFYLSLPLFAVPLRIIRPYVLIISAIAAAAFIIWCEGILTVRNPYFIAESFACGIAAAFIARWKPFSSFVSGAIGAIIALLAVGLAVSLFRTAFTTPVLFLLAIAFTIIASGNTLFGALSNPSARTLGAIAYSIYLIHSVILFIAFKFILGTDTAAALSPLGHWLAILGCTVVLIPVCFMTFNFIEAPAMRVVPPISARIESRLAVLISRKLDA